MVVTGVIEKILPLEKGQSKEGKEWQKQLFLIKTNEQYNNLYCFEIFGDEKVQNFNKYNKEGQTVEVDFNVNCKEYNGKYYTSLSMWKIKALSEASPEPVESDEPPF